MKLKQDNSQLSFLQGRTKQGQGSPLKLLVLLLLMVFCMMFYYFGELIDWAAWDFLRINFFYSVHDVHRLIFLAPIVYSAYVFGMRATVITTIITVMTFLPRALFISPYPDPMLRMLLFSAAAAAIGYLVAVVRRESLRRSRLESLLISERDKLTGILERIEDGIVIIGPDYRVRFMNSSMERDFGENTDSFCYRLIYGTDAPCYGECHLTEIIAGNISRWKYELPDGRKYEVQASPYTDSDGVVCQLTSFRKIETGNGEIEQTDSVT